MPAEPRVEDFLAEVKKRLQLIDRRLTGPVFTEQSPHGTAPYTYVEPADEQQGIALEVPVGSSGYAAQVVTVLAPNEQLRSRGRSRRSRRRQGSDGSQTHGSTAGRAFKLLDRVLSLRGDRGGWSITVVSRLFDRRFDLPVYGGNPPIGGEDVPAVICEVHAIPSRS